MVTLKINTNKTVIIGMNNNPNEMDEDEEYPDDGCCDRADGTWL